MENKTKELMKSVINEKNPAQKNLGLLELINLSLNYQETEDIIDKIGTDFVTNQSKFKTRERALEKKICLRLPRDGHYIFSRMHLPKDMNVSELLKIIGANELVEYHNHPEHVRDNKKYRNSGELENETSYDVHTSDTDNTIELIKKYNHRN